MPDPETGSERPRDKVHKGLRRANSAEQTTKMTTLMLKRATTPEQKGRFHQSMHPGVFNFGTPIVPADGAGGCDVAAAPPALEPPHLQPLDDAIADNHLPGAVASVTIGGAGDFLEEAPELKSSERVADDPDHEDSVAPFDSSDTGKRGSNATEEGKGSERDLTMEEAGFMEEGYNTGKRKTHFDFVVTEEEAPPEIDYPESSSEEESTDDEANHFQVLQVWQATTEVHGVKMAAFTSETTKSNKMKNIALIKAATAAIGSSLAPSETDDKFKMCEMIIFAPSCFSRVTWELLGLMMVIYDIISIPLVLLDPPKNQATTTIDWTCRVFWTMDIPFTFITGFMMSNGNVVMDPRRIAWNYSTKWLFLDLVLVSTDWAEIAWGGNQHAQGSARMGKVSRIFRMMRIVRLVRVARMKQFLQNSRTRLKSEGLMIVVDIAKILVAVLASAHYVACAWYGIGQAEDQERSWIYANQYDRRPLEQRYLIAFHWSMAQFHGGMDEIVPVGVTERIYAVCISVLAWLAAAAFVSGLTSEMTRLHILASQQARQLSVLTRYLKQCRISDQLSIRVQRNAQHALHEQQRLMPENEVELLHLVSEALREELHFEMYSPVLEVHSFFAVYTNECPQVMRKVCHIAMSTLLISTGDVVFNAGEIPQFPKMYVVCSGTLEYIPLSGNVIEVFAAHWLSEAVLWTPWMHRGVLKATSEGRLCLLDAMRFQEIVGCFDHTPQQIDPKHYACNYVKHLNALLDLNQLDKITDMPNNEEINLCRKCYYMRHDTKSYGSSHERRHSDLDDFVSVARRRRSAFMDGATTNVAAEAVRTAVNRARSASRISISATKTGASIVRKSTTGALGGTSSAEKNKAPQEDNGNHHTKTTAMTRVVNFFGHRNSDRS